MLKFFGLEFEFVIKCLNEWLLFNNFNRQHHLTYYRLLCAYIKDNQDFQASLVSASDSSLDIEEVVSSHRQASLKCCY